MPTYDFYVEVNKTNLEKVCPNPIVPESGKSPISPGCCKQVSYYQYTNYPFVPKSKGKESGNQIQYYPCSATSHPRGDSGGNVWPIQNSFNQGTGATSGSSGGGLPNSNEPNSIPPWYVDPGGAGNFNVGTGFVNFATPKISNPTSGLYNFGNFLGYTSGGPVSLNTLFKKAFGNETENYITSWYNVNLYNTKMIGYCPDQYPVRDHGEAQNVLTQTFQTGAPPSLTSCTKGYQNQISYDNHEGVMPSDYNMVGGAGLNVGPFASVFDPGSQLAGGTTYNGFYDKDGAAVVYCKGSDRGNNEQAEFFNDPTTSNNPSPYMTGSGNYTPQCHFSGGGGYGNSNVCAKCEFSFDIPYYPLKKYNTSPNVNNGVYTPPNLSATTIYSYYSVSPLTTTPKAFLHPGMNGFPNINDVVAPSGSTIIQDQKTGIPKSGWTFDTAQIQYEGSDNSAITDYINNGMNTYGVYGVYKLTYTVSDSDFTDDLEYKLRDLFALQQWLLPEYSPWFVGSSYWATTKQSMKQMVVDYCNKTKNMSCSLCSSQNLGFDFLTSSPCIENTSTCMNGWSSYCNTSDNFFSDTCLNVYQKSYVDGNLAPDIQNLLTTNCSTYANSTNDSNLSSDFLRVCGCYLPSKYYDDVFESNSELANQVGGYNYRQCWYLPCIYSNLPPVNPTDMTCENNNISNCIQTTVANYTDMSGTLADNTIAVNSYINNCGTKPTPDIQIAVNQPTSNQPSEIMTVSPLPTSLPRPISSASSSSSVIQPRKYIFDMSLTQKVFLSVLAALVIGVIFVYLGKTFQGKL